jgi:prephenate dehydrogenase
VRAALEAAAGDCVVTDVGSTKRGLVATVEDRRFIGGHPLAGAETAGVEHARAELFDGATWYLTPTARTEGVLYDRLYRLLADLGARPAAIDAETHDRLMASVSHLPHVLANVLVAQAARVLSAEGERLPATGPSFRDMTRVAGANTLLWRDIYLANGDALVRAIDDAMERLGAVRTLLATADGDGVAAWNDAAREERRRLLEADLAGGEVHELRVQVPNRPGIVAEIALALGRASIDIVDMALYPTGGGSHGTIALWVRAGEIAQAQSLVADLGLEVARA